MSSLRMVGATIIDPSWNNACTQPIRPRVFIPSPPEIAAPAYRRKARPTPLLLEEIAPAPHPRSQPEASLQPAVQHDIVSSTFQYHSKSQPQILLQPVTQPELVTPSYQQRSKMSTPIMQTGVRQAGHVWFNSPVNSLHVVTPYSQVYGIHPKYFHFDANGGVQPTPKAEGGFLGARGLEMAAKITDGKIIPSRVPIIFSEERVDCPPTARGDNAVVWSSETHNLCSTPVCLQPSVDDKKVRRPVRQKLAESKFYSSPAAITPHPEVAEAPPPCSSPTDRVPAPCPSPTDSGFFKSDVQKSAALLAHAVASLTVSPR